MASAYPLRGYQRRHRVVAPKAGLDDVRHLCPTGTRVLADDEPGKAGWFDVRVIPPGGRGRAPVAYEVRWAGKTVLVSGRIPVKLTNTTAKRLLEEFTGKDGSAEKYRDALGQLAEVAPDLWLPAVPVHGQNAFIYDDEGVSLLAQHRHLTRMAP
jgi:hypothetical protein